MWSPSRASAAALAALLGALALAACQPRPQPFRPEVKDGTNKLLVRRDIGGVVVRPVAGLAKPDADALSAAMVAALQKAEIPAETRSGNRLSLILDGAAKARPGHAVDIDWRLIDSAGRVHGTAHAVGPPSDAQGLASQAAPTLAAFVEGHPAGPAGPAAAADGTKDGQTVLTVWPVVGAPGDGDPALSHAMHDALMAAEVPVSDQITDRGLVIAGSVHVTRAALGREEVEILWTVFDTSGAQVAKLAQNNTVPKGALDGKWGPLAREICDSAVPGVLQMLRSLPAAPAARGG